MPTIYEFSAAVVSNEMNEFNKNDDLIIAKFRYEIVKLYAHTLTDDYCAQLESFSIPSMQEYNAAIERKNENKIQKNDDLIIIKYRLNI